MGFIVSSPGSLNPVLIERRTLSAAASYTSLTWGVNQFSRIVAKIMLSSGAIVGGTDNFTLTGDTGSHTSNIIYCANGGAPGGVKLAYNAISLTGPGQATLECDLTTANKTFTAVVGGSAAGVPQTNIISGFSSDTTHAVTGLVVNFSTAGSGYIDLWGYP